jgi:proteic killer suppression protein
VEIESILDKALRRFVETGQAKGLIEPIRIAKMVTYIAKVANFEELSILPNFGFHSLTGDRAGTYALTVTRNWRMTFTKIDEQTIADLDLEDYH